MHPMSGITPSLPILQLQKMSQLAGSATTSCRKCFCHVENLQIGTRRIERTPPKFSQVFSGPVGMVVKNCSNLTTECNTFVQMFQTFCSAPSVFQQSDILSRQNLLFMAKCKLLETFLYHVFFLSMGTSDECLMDTL
jgi:hypothetical protein